MASRHLLFRSEAREKILRGAGALADAVRVTLGPMSRSVLIGKRWGSPIVCNDGVTVARELELEDPEENLGARMIRQAAEKTGDVVGDGTTTATLLAHALFAEGLKNVVAGASAVELRRGLVRGLSAAVKAIRASSRPVEGRDEMAQVATVAAHNDAAIGALVAEAVDRVGPDGVVTLESARGTETTLELVEGMQFDRGYLSPYFVTDESRMECVLEQPLLLLHDGRIAAMKELVPLLEQLVQQGRPLVLVADEVEGEALATLVLNKLRGSLPCVAVKTPGYGDRRRALLEDLAVLTGGQVVSTEAGRSLAHAGAEVLGHAQRVVVTRDDTTIVGGQGSREALRARVAHLRAQALAATTEYEREQFDKRAAHLSGGVAVIRVGAPSEAELESRKEAFDDAVHSTRAAVVEGIVPGCGLAFLRAVDAVSAEEARAAGDEQVGLRVLRHALEVPTRQIAENSGADGGVVVDRMRGGTGAYGFDAARGRYVDLVAEGIIDPTRVVRTALENAVSVAGVLLLTEATLTDIPEPRAEQPPLP
ncbi:MAG: molecular chaperone GroEL [Pseudomonadota bacterium]|jgi:chaperonin GroEL